MSVPNEPRSTDATTTKPLAPLHPCEFTEIVRSVIVVHVEEPDVRNVARASELKSRVDAAPLEGSIKSTTTENAAEEATAMPSSVARSSVGAIVSPAPFVMRTPTGCGSCKYNSACAWASTAPQVCHCTSTIRPQSRIADKLRETLHGLSAPSFCVGVSKLGVNTVTFSCVCGTSCVAPSEKFATA